MDHLFALSAVRVEVMPGAWFAHLRVAPTAGAHPARVLCGDLVWISRMNKRQLRCRDAH